MACNNAGFMVHIANMADVEEKVQVNIEKRLRTIRHSHHYVSKIHWNESNDHFQHYIRVMSRPVGEDAALTTINDAMWSGVYRERLVGSMNNQSRTVLFIQFSPRALVLEENDRAPNKTYAQMNKIASKKVQWSIWSVLKRCLFTENPYSSSRSSFSNVRDDSLVSRLCQWTIHGSRSCEYSTYWDISIGCTHDGQNLSTSSSNEIEIISDWWSFVLLYARSKWIRYVPSSIKGHGQSILFIPLVE